MAKSNRKEGQKVKQCPQCVWNSFYAYMRYSRMRSIVLPWLANSAPLKIFSLSDVMFYDITWYQIHKLPKQKRSKTTENILMTSSVKILMSTFRNMLYIIRKLFEFCFQICKYHVYILSLSKVTAVFIHI